MNDAIENALNEYAASGVIQFEIDEGDDRFDYEYGSIRGTHGDGPYCNVGCGENKIVLTVAVGEVDAAAVGTVGSLTIDMDSGHHNTNVGVEFDWTVKSVNVEEGTVTIQFNYWGCESVEFELDYDYDDGRDYDYDYGPY